MPPSLLTFPGTMLLAVPAPAGATFQDGANRAQPAVALSSATWATSWVFPCGRGEDLLVQLHAAFGGGGMGGFLAQLETAIDDANNPGTWTWAPVQTARSDSGLVLAQHSFASADFTGPDAGDGTGTARDILLQTTSHRLQTYGRLLVKASAAPAAGDAIWARWAL